MEDPNTSSHPRHWLAKADSGQQSTQLSISSRMGDVTDLHPVSREEFAAEMSACLALVAPVGMDQAAKRLWLTAAYRALDGIPIALLKKGATAAMKTADHPAKVVPAIMREIESDWNWRKRQLENTISHKMLQAPKQDAISEDERVKVGSLMRGLIAKLEAKG
jgi:hypothetical protein